MNRVTGEAIMSRPTTRRLLKSVLTAIALSALMIVTNSARAEDLCFQNWINQNSHQDLWLRHDGSYESINYDGGTIEWRDHGRWLRGEGMEITFLSVDNVKGVVSEALYVGVHLRRNVPLLPKLKQVIMDFLRRHPEKQFDQQTVMDEVKVLGDPCPREHQYICTGGCSGGEARYFVNASFRDLRESVTRKDLEVLAAVIDKYVADGYERQFGATLVSEGNRTAVAMHDYGAGWAWQPTDPEELSESLRERGRSGITLTIGREGDGSWSQVPCSNLGPK